MPPVSIPPAIKALVDRSTAFVRDSGGAARRLLGGAPRSPRGATHDSKRGERGERVTAAKAAPEPRVAAVDSTLANGGGPLGARALAVFRRAVALGREPKGSLVILAVVAVFVTMRTASLLAPAPARHGAITSAAATTPTGAAEAKAPAVKAAALSKKHGGLPEGTAIATPDGPIPVQEVEVGDPLLAFDEEEDEVTVRKVKAVFVVDSAPLVRVVMDAPDGKSDTMNVPPGHKFWTAGGDWIAAGALTKGATLMNAAGEAVVVKAVEAAKASKGYAFEIESDPSYFLGDALVLARNGS